MARPFLERFPKTGSISESYALCNWVNMEGACSAGALPPNTGEDHQ
jgi:hypothetical protein